MSVPHNLNLMLRVLTGPEAHVPRRSLVIGIIRRSNAKILLLCWSIGIEFVAEINHVAVKRLSSFDYRSPSSRKLVAGERNLVSRQT